MTIDTSSQSAIHTSQLRQPGDYLKNNRMRASSPRVHMFTVEAKQKLENKHFTKKGQLPTSDEREQWPTRD